VIMQIGEDALKSADTASVTTRTLPPRSRT